jgi:hypothetical protein
MMLGGIRGAVLGLTRAESVDEFVGKRIEEEALLCHHLVARLLETCERVRRDAVPLVDPLRHAERLGPRWDVIVEERLAKGSLPFANSEICPVSSYGVMEPFKYGNRPELQAFAAEHLRDYEELDEIGSVANGWARQLALAAREILAGRPSIPRGRSRR